MRRQAPSLCQREGQGEGMSISMGVDGLATRRLKSLLRLTPFRCAAAGLYKPALAKDDKSSHFVLYRIKPNKFVNAI